jgi:predicted nucleic acid-binding protein
MPSDSKAGKIGAKCMPPENPIYGIDSNIIIYALDKSGGEKHVLAKRIVERCMKGDITLAITNQVLAETAFNVEDSIPPEEWDAFLFAILHLPNWKKISYSHATVVKLSSRNPKNDFWDALIFETLRENHISHLYTENTKDFPKGSGIIAINPFVQK